MLEGYNGGESCKAINWIEIKHSMKNRYYNNLSCTAANMHLIDEFRYKYNPTTTRQKTGAPADPTDL